MNTLLKRLVWLVIAAPLLFLLVIWKQLPDQVATHFDLHGQADKYGSRDQLWISTGVIALMSILVFLLITNVYRLDPKKRAAENRDRLLRMAFSTVVFLAVVSSTVIYASWKSGGVRFNIHFLFSAIGLFWAVLGNYMHNLRPNYFAGFRLPWTLESEENWRLTHQLAGKLWFAGGLILAALCAFLPDMVAAFTFFAGALILVTIPIVYSYRLYRSQAKGAGT
ncbi:MAG TPA: SdpI family protein [Chitinophagaceae bacterium]|nr:SdpI family protein [Chitinophagaceae bacterium]